MIDDISKSNDSSSLDAILTQSLQSQKLIETYKVHQV